MRLSRSDLLPMLTIVAGVALGASLSFGFLGSRSDNVPAPDPVVAPALTVAAATPAVRRGIVTGRITDEQTGESVAAVQVYFSNLKLGGLSQQTGRWTAADRRRRHAGTRSGGRGAGRGAIDLPSIYDRETGAMAVGVGGGGHRGGATGLVVT